MHQCSTWIARSQLGEVAQPAFHRRGAARVAAGLLLLALARIEFGLGDQREPLGPEAGPPASGPVVSAIRASEARKAARSALGSTRDAALGEEVQHRLLAAGRSARIRTAAGKAGREGAQLEQRVARAPLDREIGQRFGDAGVLALPKWIRVRSPAATQELRLGSATGRVRRQQRPRRDRCRAGGGGSSSRQQVLIAP